MNNYKMTSCYDDIVLRWFEGFRVWRFFLGLCLLGLGFCCAWFWGVSGFLFLLR